MLRTLASFSKLHSSCSAEDGNQKSPVLSVTNAHFLGMLSMSGILPQLPLPVSLFTIYGTKLQCLGHRTQSWGMNAIWFLSCLSLLEIQLIHLGNIY